jgi:hypothetical protein
MTAPGGDHGEPYRNQPGRDQPDQPYPWQQYQHPPVDPQAPVNYPEYPYPPQPPPYGPVGYGGPPSGFGPPYGGPGGPGGYGGFSGPPVPYPAAYDPYQDYPSQRTNGLAVGSLITSIGALPLTFICYLGLPAAIIGLVLGAVALTQIKQTQQQGRGLAIAGIVIGAILAALLALVPMMFGLAALDSPAFWQQTR